MDIALAQMDVLVNQPRKNIETILRMTAQAKEQKMDLIVFPEQALAGYLLGDKWTEDAFVKDLMSYHDDIVAASDGIAIAYGTSIIDERAGIHPNKDGRSRKFNALRIVQNGKPAPRLKEHGLLMAGMQPKTLHPNYRIFDDERYWLSLRDFADDMGVALKSLLQPYVIYDKLGNGVPIGFEICEDLWVRDYRDNGQARNPTKMLLDNGAQLIINASASPWTFGKNNARDNAVKFLKQDCGTTFKPFLYVNHTGVQNNGKNFVTFDGGTTVYNSQGQAVQISTKPREEELIAVNTKQIDGLTAIVRNEPSEIEQKYHAIIQAIRHMADIVGKHEQPTYVIGLSGGVDSAVVAALLVQAVGVDKVIGVNMPTEYNSEKTKNAAAHVARKLGIKYDVVPIGEIVDAVETVVENADLNGTGKKLSVLNKENIQAKIRGTDMLSNLAAKYGALFTNNGNKLEAWLGYATLYGDVGGAIAPIGDLTKTDVFEMAKFLNKSVYCTDVIPQVMIPDALFRFTDDQIAPSAELKEKQIDPMKFGYHCALVKQMLDYKRATMDDIAQWYIDGVLHKKLGIPVELMQRWDVDKPEIFIPDLEWFVKGGNNAVFKRVQTCPNALVTKTAFGFDNRESQLPYNETRNYQRLKQKILTEKIQYTPKGDA
ncbi:MAG TPA: NAD(+) synthase [Acidobacteriota bacterium]|nr:NAD(+) synthase [Acidobacteriota bacterium]